MTSQEIETAREIEPAWCKAQYPTIVPLWEIALQLAVSNEISKKLDDAILSDPPKMPYGLADPQPSKTNPFGERGEWHQGEALEIAGELLNNISGVLELDRRAIALEMQQYALRFALAHQKPDAEQERMDMIQREYAVLEESRKRTMTTLRIAAQTIQNLDLDRIGAVDYLLKYAEAFERNEELTERQEQARQQILRDLPTVDQPQWTAGGSIQGTE